MAKSASHMRDPHGDPQTSPQHADPHGLGGLFKENHTRNPCISACCGLVCGSPCGSPMWGGGKFRHGLLEKSLIEAHHQTQCLTTVLLRCLRTVCLHMGKPCVSKQCPASGDRGESPDRVLKTRFTPLKELRWTRFTPSEST